MQRLEYLGPGELAWREAEAPALQADIQALVRPIAVATCDLDALIIAGQSPFAAPFPIGHECVAEVLDAGDRVTARYFRYSSSLTDSRPGSAIGSDARVRPCGSKRSHQSRSHALRDRQRAGLYAARPFALSASTLR